MPSITSSKRAHQGSASSVVSSTSKKATKSCRTSSSKKSQPSSSSTKHQSSSSSKRIEDYLADPVHAQPQCRVHHGVNDIDLAAAYRAQKELDELEDMMAQYGT